MVITVLNARLVLYATMIRLKELWLTLTNTLRAKRVVRFRRDRDETEKVRTGGE